ncbi:unnamed protein product [Adineta steineri]|uniref:Uncharacterized protein n=1 Tax=Adineta steineri TaxID=433720 RepID=A0A813W929_9BILA|nr:unnamed protein product [Adineta steineri]
MKSNEFFIGISLALLSYLFIGSSFVLKKKGLLKLTNVRAGFGYLYEIQWWIGLITMGIGEICNFVAYGFAPASVLVRFTICSLLGAFTITACKGIAIGLKELYTYK